MPGRIGFEFELTQKRMAQKPLDEDAPLRILLLGDFGGRALRGAGAPGQIADRPIMAVDVDNFDRVLAHVAPQAHLGPDDDAAAVVFEPHSLDDFHPDHLFRELPLFRELRATRARLQDPKTFAEAAAALRTPTAAAPAAAPAKAEDDAGMLDRLLGGKAAGPAPAAAPAADALQSLIRRVVAPHIVPDAPPFQAQYVQSIESAIAEQMRAVLHHPAFQRLEAAWRSAHLLATGLETGEQVKLFLLDVSREELAADLAAAGHPERTLLYRRLVEQGTRAVGGEPWSVIVGDYAFGPITEDVALLAALGAVAAHAGGPFLAGAETALAGCASITSNTEPRDWSPPVGEGAQAWAELRRSTLAPWIGLALPRVMLRLPYGRRTDAIQGFDFEEQPGAGRHDAYLWGNPAFACALLLGRAFTENGPGMEPGDVLDVEDLPAHIVERDGEKAMQACAEVFLTERAGEALIAQGLMPLASYRNRNAARVMRFQSIAEPAQPLSGFWA